MINNGIEMKYNPQQDRWVVNMGHRQYGLHCGECFDILIGKMSISCRLEMGSSWYIIMQGTRFNLRTQDTYMVKI